MYGKLDGLKSNRTLDVVWRGERLTSDEAALEADRERSRTWLRQALDGVRREIAESR